MIWTPEPQGPSGAFSALRPSSPKALRRHFQLSRFLNQPTKGNYHAATILHFRTHPQVAAASRRLALLQVRIDSRPLNAAFHHVPLRQARYSMRASTQMA